MILLIGIQMVTATNSTESHGVTLSGSSTDTEWRGMNITVGATPVYLVNYTKHSSSVTNGTAILVTGVGCTQIASATFSGDTATFSPMPLLSAGQKYAVLVRSTGTVRYASAGYPIANSYITWTRGIYHGCALTNTEANEILSVGVSTEAGNSSTDNPPTITLNSPIAFYNSSISTNIFNVTVTDGQLVSNVSLYLNGVLNQTNTSNVNGTYWFTKTLTDGTYSWFISAYDNASQQTNSSSRNITVDTTNPILNITEQNYTYQNILNSNITLNITYIETNPHSCWFNYNGTNRTFNCLQKGFNFSAVSMDTDIYVFMNDTTGHEISDYWNWTITPTTLTFNILNYLGGIISSVLWTGDITHTGNPYTALMNSYLNDTNKSVNLSANIQDLTYYNQDENFTVNVNTSTTTYNLTLDPNQLYLAFYNGTQLNDTKFEIYDKDKLFANSSSSVVVVQQNLSLGNVYVRFNEDDYGVNWTQFYEYTNDYETHVTENLSLLDTADWTIYFTIQAKDGRVIENAVLRAEYSSATAGSWTTNSLIGQRLTQSDGTTFFRFDSSTYATVTVTAEGYDAKEVALVVGDESASTKSTSYIVYMDESDSGVNNNVWIYYPKWITNKTFDIAGIIMAKQADQVTINTDYRAGLGLGTRELTNTGRGKYNASLISGTDFSSSASGDIVVYIYVDGVNIKNWTIEEKVPTRIFDISTDIDDETLIVAGTIGLIFISGAIGMIFTSATAGFSAFMIGSILMALVSVNFLYLSIVSLLYFVLKLIKRLISE